MISEYSEYSSEYRVIVLKRLEFLKIGFRALFYKWINMMEYWWNYK